MSERPLSARSAVADNVTMFGSRSRWRTGSFLFLLLASFLFFTSCSGVSNSSNNSGGNGGGGGGGNGGGTGGGNLACNVMSTGQGSSLNGFVPFTGSNLWSTDISSAPVDSNSNSIITNWVGSVNVHPDWGNDPTYGIPYVVVDGNQPLVSVNLQAYGDESDPGPMPIPASAPIEGGSSSNGDRHVLVLDSGNCFLYELYNSSVNSNGSWNADSTAVWDLLADEQRPYTWTSADAAGLPIFPGLVRYDEVVEQKAINHALRFTCPQTRKAYVPPATHYASSDTSSKLPPMGMRVRLKANFDTTGFSPNVRVVLRAMMKYGMFVADNGSGWFVSGAPDPRWNEDELATFSRVPSSAFEVVKP